MEERNEVSGVNPDTSLVVGIESSLGIGVADSRRRGSGGLVQPKVAHVSQGRRTVRQVHFLGIFVHASWLRVWL